MYELYGIPVGTTVVFETFVNSLYPDDRQVTLTLVQEAVAGKAEYDMEFRVIHPDGSIHFLKCHGAVMRDDQGNPLRIIGVNFEITQQKQTEQIIRQQIEKETLLRQITQHIRETLDLQQIFETACLDIRQFIQSDRVGIFQFYPDSGFDDGEFVAESVKEGFSSLLSIPIHDHCFGEDYSQRYTQGHFQAVSDVLNSDLQDCHKAVLTQFQIRANLVIPLLLGEGLWGLLCIHSCDAPRIWQPDEIDLIQQIADQLAIAIQQGDLYNQIQAELIIRQQAEEKIVLELRRKQLLGEIIQLVRDSLDITEILVNVTHKIQEILNSDRVIVFQLFSDGRSQIVEESVSDPFPRLKNLYWEDEVWPQEILDYYWQGIPRIVPDVINDQWTDCLMEYSIEGQIQSKIVAPILQETHNQEDHRWVSSDKKDRLWGVLVVHACGEKRVWQDEEAEILQQIANQLAIAIQQANLFKELQKEQQKLTQTNQALTQSNENLARATRLKDEFLANMSHELRTPLTAILGMSEVLQTNTFGKINPAQEKAIKLIEKSGEHLLTLINDILDLSKIEAGKLELKLAPTSVQILCENSTIFVRHMALTQNIELQTHIAKNIDQILVDELRIRQCLINLLSNAIKFTPTGGNVILSVELEEKDILFSVTDTGIGISPTDLDKLFQPFIQIDSSLNRQYAGTGLGLVLVERIITKHGGRVLVTSRVGEGSCFAFRLPYSPSSKKNMPENVETTSLSANETNAPLSVSPLILLADDNETNRQTLDDYLSNKGYRILLAYNGREAVEMVKARQPDLILMDIQMPEMDGLEATTLIRSDPAIAHIPIIALTALALPEQVERCLAVGINEYLVKPLRFKVLMETIQKFC
jgi:signal transduction histidine kinase